MKKTLLIVLLSITSLGLWAQKSDCEFIPFFYGSESLTSYAEIDSIRIIMYHPSRFVFEPHEWADSYDLFDFQYQLSKYGSITVGITTREKIFIEIGWGDKDCVLREAVAYLRNPTNINRKPLFDEKK